MSKVLSGGAAEPSVATTTAASSPSPLRTSDHCGPSSLAQAASTTPPRCVNTCRSFPHSRPVLPRVDHIQQPRVTRNGSAALTHRKNLLRSPTKTLSLRGPLQTWTIRSFPYKTGLSRVQSGIYSAPREAPGVMASRYEFMLIMVHRRCEALSGRRRRQRHAGTSLRRPLRIRSGHARREDPRRPRCPIRCSVAPVARPPHGRDTHSLLGTCRLVVNRVSFMSVNRGTDLQKINTLY